MRPSIDKLPKLPLNISATYETLFTGFNKITSEHLLRTNDSKNSSIDFENWTRQKLEQEQVKVKDNPSIDNQGKKKVDLEFISEIMVEGAKNIENIEQDADVVVLMGYTGAGKTAFYSQ